MQNVSSHNGLLAWSRVGSDGRARLVHRVRGRGRDVPVRPKSGGLFDPDVGTTRSGHETIVYTRCAGLSGRDCDVWRWDGGSRRERKVPGASSGRCSELAPSVWLGTVAFGRSGPEGCAGLYAVRRGKVRRLDSRVPADTDLRGNRVAYLFLPPAETSVSYVRVKDLYGGRSRLVAGGRMELSPSRVTSPVIEGRYVYFLREDLGFDVESVVRTPAERPARREYGPRTPRSATSIGVTRDRVYYTDRSGLHDVRASDWLSFK